ncbi:MAG: S8 family serine peptidase [Thermoanaerobaculia bacterium]
MASTRPGAPSSLVPILVLALTVCALPAGALVPGYSTDRAVRNERTVPVVGADLTLKTWDELDAVRGWIGMVAVLDGDGGLQGRVREAGTRVELASGSFDPLLDGEVDLPASLAAREGDRLYLVQLFTPAQDALQGVLRDLGATIYRYYTQNAMLVEMDAAVRAAVAAQGFVRWVGPYHPAFRLDPTLWADFENDALGERRYSMVLNRRGGEMQRAVGRDVRAGGGTVDMTTPDSFRMEITAEQDIVDRLLHDDRVQWIEPWQGPAGTDMDIVRQVGGADYVEAQTGFTGQGVRGEVFDTETLLTHQEWASTPILHSAGSSGVNGLHGTSCSSNVFAQGTNAQARGMIPSGQEIFFLLDECTQFGGAKTRAAIASELLDPVGPYRAVFQTSSVGNTQVTTYTTISAEMDDVLFNNQLLHTQSQSNTGSQLSRPQAWAKNIVSVGGIRHLGTADRSDDFWGSGASIGPAADGRIKPELAFFYDSIFSAQGSSPTSYTQFGGTSSATPQTAGHFGLLFQMWHEGVWPGHGGAATVFDSRPHMITAKALMINQAFRYDWNAGGSNADLDRFKQGWGTADVRNLLDNGDATVVHDEDIVLEQGQTYSTTVTLGPDEPSLQVTMAYVDPMGTVGAGVARINDLSLRVTSPSSTVYWGNNGLTADNVSTSGGVSNTVDTVENVFVADPEAGTWTIDVLADEVVQDAHVETGAVDADASLIIFPDRSTLFADGFESGNTSAWTMTAN